MRLNVHLFFMCNNPNDIKELIQNFLHLILCMSESQHYVLIIDCNESM